jgi:hypothetical protein
MSSELDEHGQGAIDPLNLTGSESTEDLVNPFGFEDALDPLDLFGLQAAGDIEAEGAAARGRVKELMRSAESMRQSVLTQIKERDLEASRATANMQRESLLRRGRSSTIL